jgi:hypothetical protein
MLKPHRVVARKFSSYAEEASAFMRRRRHHRRPYVRIQFRSGEAVELPPDGDEASQIMAAVTGLIEHSR